jgi:hypothetical protein
MVDKWKSQFRVMPSELCIVPFAGAKGDSELAREIRNLNHAEHGVRQERLGAFPRTVPSVQG